MKLKLLCVAMALFITKAFSQDVTKVFGEVKTVNIRSSGVIKKNNVVKGYFNFYEFDKVDHDTRVFKLNLLDENLNTLGTKEILGPKDWALVSSGFDGNDFCFKFWNEKEKTFELRVYDQQGNQVNARTLKINYNPKGMKYVSFFQSGVSPELGIIDNTGFVNYTYNDPNDAFIITYAGEANQQAWARMYQPEGKSKIMLPTFLGGNNEMILTAVMRIDPGFSGRTQCSVLSSRVSDGAQYFDVSTDFADNHVVPVNAVFEDGKITIIGLNYKVAKTFNSPPDGFAFLQYDRTGKLLKSNFKTFDESLGKYLPISGGKLDGDYLLYIHDIVRTANNTSLVLAEKFKKPGGSGALAFLATVSGTSLVSLQLENMVVIEYDKDGNVIQAKEIPKAKGSTGSFPSYAGFLSPYTLVTAAKFYGWMDYRYTLKSDDNSEIAFSFVDYDKLEDNDKKTQNFGQIKYKDGKITTDKVAIKKEKATFSYILPAKANHLIQVNYYKKEKKLSMDMIKLN